MVLSETNLYGLTTQIFLTNLNVNYLIRDCTLMYSVFLCGQICSFDPLKIASD